MSALPTAEQMLDEELRLEHELALELARTSLLGFIKYMDPDYFVNWHHRLLCDELDKVIAGDSKRLIVSAPPRHGKTQVLSRFFPAYFFGRFPDLPMIATSYGSDLAQRNSRDVQRIMDDERYLEVFPDTRLWSSNVRTVAQGTFLRNADMFEIVNRRGVYRAAGVGGSVTGMGAYGLLCDDNLRNSADASSVTILNSQWEWYNSTFRTRLAKGGFIIIVATRWSHSDIIGRLIDQANESPDADQWRVINLPAICISGPTDDDPRQPGEALWPAFFPVQELEKMRAGSARTFEALYQGNPTPPGGGLINLDWFKEYIQADLPRRFEKVIASWDLTFSDKKSGDWCVGQVWGLHKGQAYLLDQYRKQVAFTEQCRAVVALLNKWPQITALVVEEAANGAALIDTLKSTIPNVIGIRATKSKTVRAEAVTPIIEAGNVHVPITTGGGWMGIFRDEVARFPMGQHDDQVDAMVQALHRLFPPKRVNFAFEPISLTKSSIYKM